MAARKPSEVENDLISAYRDLEVLKSFDDFSEFTTMIEKLEERRSKLSRELEESKKFWYSFRWNLSFKELLCTFIDSIKKINANNWTLKTIKESEMKLECFLNRCMAKKIINNWNLNFEVNKDISVVVSYKIIAQSEDIFTETFLLVKLECKPK